MKRGLPAKILTVVVCAVMLTACGKKESSLPEPTTAEEETETKTEITEQIKADEVRQVIIDGSKAIKDENRRYEGMGYISANNSSRLLLDYKDENPEAYWEILNYIFGSDGLNVGLFKLEMGADVDSSSGTEPAVKRSAEEAADVTRGAGYQLAADAVKVNPDLQIDMLYWGMPSWVDEPENTMDKYAARYKWYKETIDAFYDTYNCKLSYITVGRNERGVEPDFVKYVADAFENEQDERYDYGSIKIVAGEGVCDWDISKLMLEDEKLMKVVDVVTSHYTSFTSNETKKIQADNGKKVWFSEGSSPMKSEKLAHNKEDYGSGIGGLNGMLDIASRITQAMTEGMTMYEFQPLVSAYYSGATFFPKQLITANEPWSGAYSLDAGYYMTLHFSRFIKNGWEFVENACYGDGVPGGDGHAIVDSTFNYITCTDPDTGDYSTVIVNNSDKILEYDFELQNMAKSDSDVYVYETIDSYDGTGNYYDSFFKSKGFVKPENSKFSVTVKPYSMITVSTLDIGTTEYKDRSADYHNLELPYEDDFEYSGYEDDYLAQRGMAPRYTTDQGGAFEVAQKDGTNVLMQMITSDNKPVDWGSTSDPVTTLLDDKWQNYTVSADVHFTDNKVESKKDNYVGIGARYNLASNDYSGYVLKLMETGEVTLSKAKSKLVSKTVDGLSPDEWHNLKLKVEDNTITAYLDDEQIIEYVDEENVVNSGRIALYSSYQNNYFDNLKVSADSENYSVTRIDDMDASVTYSKGSTDKEAQGWYFNTISSYTNYNRTVSVGEQDDYLEFEFTGSSFALIGNQSKAVLDIEVDGESFEYVCSGSGDRTAVYAGFGLKDSTHTVKVTVKDGKINLDAIEYR